MTRGSGRDGVATLGTGRVAVVPDVVVARLAAEATDESAATAHQAAAAGATAVIAALRAAGVADRDLRTAAMSSWTDPGATVTEGGLVATRRPRTTVTLAVEARLEVATSGEVIGVALEAAGDAARLEGTSLRLSDPAAARERARALAFADAVAAAEQLARLAGRALGPVLEIREGGSGGGGPMMEDMAMRAVAVPVEAGEQEVLVQLAVRHGWADAYDTPATTG